MGMEIRIELDGELAKHVAGLTDGQGFYASVEEYVHDLIRRDADCDDTAYLKFKKELQDAFAAPEEDAVELTADDFLAQVKSRSA